MVLMRSKVRRESMVYIPEASLNIGTVYVLCPHGRHTTQHKLLKCQEKVHAIVVI